MTRRLAHLCFLAGSVLFALGFKLLARRARRRTPGTGPIDLRGQSIEQQRLAALSLTLGAHNGGGRA